MLVLGCAPSYSAERCILPFHAPVFEHGYPSFHRVDDPIVDVADKANGETCASSRNEFSVLQNELLHWLSPANIAL